MKHRIAQFRAAQFPRHLDGDDVQLLSRQLSCAERDIFLKMQVVDQRHSLDLCRRLIQAGHCDRDLLTAALLHDVGKAQADLRTWHRVLVVLMGRFWPQALHRWVGEGCCLLIRPLWVALHHADLGAAAAQRAGSSERVVNLIRNHERTQHLSDELAGILRRFDGEL